VTTPLFDGEESYIAYPPLTNIHDDLRVELEFKPVQRDGLIFFCGGKKMKVEDFVAISMVKGHHPSNLNAKIRKSTAVFKTRLNFLSKYSSTHQPAHPSAQMIEDFLGEGGFGIVAKCRDTKTNQAVAIKVNKNRTDILEQAKKEIFILEQGWIQMPPTLFNGTAFSLTENQCLWDYIGDPNNRRLPISEVRPILGQLTNALSHLGSLGIVHADLKPGNIMVVKRYESPVKVRLIDFGLACPASAVMPGDRVGTVGYSAPEVMLGLPYNEACDMWSLGLVAVELVTGVPLYPGKKYYDVLKFIIETQGHYLIFCLSRIHLLFISNERILFVL
uniref:Protein kinase domain-containing protein n=1 Tax=Maylandia zebra TaxID=106582 RepID=A0A3P9D5D8_9CICH